MKLKNKKIRLTEVGPRDGLQNEKKIVSVEDRVNWIQQLANTGVDEIEFGAFVSPKWVPQMQGSDEVYQKIKHLENQVELTALVPNDKGFEKALELGCKKIALFMATSETFSQKNTNCSVAESVQRIQTLHKKAVDQGMKVRAYISTVFVCPYEGEIPPQVTAKWVKQLLDWGITDISLGDTIGRATSLQVKALFNELKSYLMDDTLDIAMHFHDTHHQALQHVQTSLDWGIRHFDSSAGGLGGCPYAPGASGNVSTEEVMALLLRNQCESSRPSPWNMALLQQSTAVLKSKL